jgi:hypothetical protein
MKTHALVPLLVLSLAACAGGRTVSGTAGSPGGSGGGGGSGGQPSVVVGNAGKPVDVALSTGQTQELARVTALLAPTKALTADALAGKRAVPFLAKLPYDPMKAVNLAQLQASHVALDDAELAALAANGFVITDKKHYPGFTYGYTTIYADDLPVFVSLDSIMHVVHRSYDDILKDVERERLVPVLATLLGDMHARLSGADLGLSKTAIADADLYLAVARALLMGGAPTVVATGDQALAGKLVDGANAAAGSKDVELFGLGAHYDFSQFKPRGHYVGEPMLEQYFRAMIWLGRTELPLIAVDENTGKTKFVRRELELAVALRRLMSAESFASWKTIDASLRAFVGEPDSMSPPDVDKLAADLGVADASGLAALSDQVVAQKIIDGGYGQQAISSQIVINGTDKTLPLARSFLFLGQRYVVDSHVLSNVVYDRVLHPPAKNRMLPNPLDVAYGALGNDQAVSLLAGELGTYAYAPDLEAMRVLVDDHASAFWSANLYNGWLSALRGLSATADIGDAKSGLPSIARTEAWGRRVLNTQLASWAELRRDTILYAKQSYSGGIACMFPDAYVDPYPAAFAALETYAKRGVELTDLLLAGGASPTATRIKTWFTHFGDVSRILREMAEHQRTGTPHTDEHLAFINDMVKIATVGCGEKVGQGWYPKLFYGYSAEALAFDPTIADVHTAPTDAAGNEIGNVLHVATGWPRLMVVTIDTCDGPRAYAGLASAYHEKLTEHYERITDQAWKIELNAAAPAGVPDVAWMKPIVVR